MGSEPFRLKSQFPSIPSVNETFFIKKHTCEIMSENLQKKEKKNTHTHT